MKEHLVLLVVLSVCVQEQNLGMCKSVPVYVYTYTHGPSEEEKEIPGERKKQTAPIWGKAASRGYWNKRRCAVLVFHDYHSRLLDPHWSSTKE